MTVLRQKMIEDMQLRGFAERTQEAYLLAVSQLARHYHKSPDQINEEELRQYFLFLKNEKRAARATCTIALCGIKFFFERTLGREWKTFEFLRPAKEKKLPVVLSVSEMGRVLGRVHRQQYRVCLTTIYACGLRLLEGARRTQAHSRAGRQRGQGAVCPFARRLPAVPETTLDDPSPPGLVVSLFTGRPKPTHE
jgi:site-specific recombinase XerD